MFLEFNFVGKLKMNFCAMILPSLDFTVMLTENKQSLDILIMLGLEAEVTWSGLQEQSLV